MPWPYANRPAILGAQPGMTHAVHLTSQVLSNAGFRHAFFTRSGGVSEGPFSSLNFSVSVGDDPARVDENLRRASATLGVGCERIYYASQVHGRDAVRAEPCIEREAFLHIEADAVFGDTPGIACGVRSADCVPILIGDRSSGAVLAVHAGWRGVVRHVLDAGVARLRQSIGGDGDLVAAIGPHLSVIRFEVSEDVATELEQSSEERDVVDRTHQKPRVDLRRIVRAQLRSLGLDDEAIDDVPGCTYSEPERFFSFRRDGKTSGRHLSAIVPRT